MDCFECGYAVFLDEDKMMLFINDDVLGFVIVSSFKFVDNNFAFFGE